jgi:hypothetical protein
MNQLPAYTARGRADAYALTHPVPHAAAHARAGDEQATPGAEERRALAVGDLEAANAAAVTAIVERAPLAGDRERGTGA